MQVVVGNQLINVGNQSVIGPGGEGLVVKAKVGKSTVALKVYHKPTKRRARKLEAFFAQNWNLPKGRIAVPLEPVFNKAKSLIVGLTMPYLGTGFDEIAQLSNKKKRATLGLTTKNVAELFLDGYNTLANIHPQGLVVGDLSDQNELFKGNKMLWIDVDSWQFGRFGCPVATEDFVDPLLYGVDFGKGPAFKPENDWYSFAVMLFRSLLLVHPYGGNYPKLNELTKRAKNKITVFDPKVKYPKIALSPDVLSDDLAHEFEKIFKNGDRGVFPKLTLQNYISDLVECSNCKTWYPKSRQGCPVCNKRTLVVISRPVVVSKDVKATQFLRTAGNIIYSRVIDNKVYVITTTNGSAELHTIDEFGNSSKKLLKDHKKGTRYELTRNILVANPNHSSDLMLYNANTKNLRPLQQSITEIFDPNRKAAFQVTENRVLRIVGGNIMAMEKGGPNVIERPVRTGIPNQTWFSANENYSGLQLFGFVQVLAERKYWYHLDGQNFEPKVASLDIGETLLDISVKFSRDEVILRRKTQFKGVSYLRADIVDSKGQPIFTSKTKFNDHPVKSMHGQVYSGGSLLHATDDGVVQEKVIDGKLKTFKQTEQFVSEGDVLHKFDQGLLIVSLDTVTYLKLK